MDPTFVSDDDAIGSSSSLSKNVAGQQVYASVFGDEEEESPRPPSSVQAFDQSAFPTSFENPEPREKAHSALEEEIFAKLANQYVEPSEKRGQPDSGEDNFAAKRAPTDFPANFADNGPFEAKASLEGEGEMSFADVFSHHSSSVPATFTSPPMNEAHSVGDSIHEEEGGVRIRMRKHTSFEEDERLDLDAVLAAASMETVTRMEALMEPSSETPRVEQEQNDKVEEHVSTPKNESSQASVVAHPDFQSLKQADARPESDNASVFDLEAVLTGASTPPKGEKKTSSPSVAVTGMIEHSVENNNNDAPSQPDLSETKKTLQSHSSSDPFSKMIREPSEFDLARALGAGEHEETEPAGVPLSPSMFERSVDSKSDANGVHAAFGGEDHQDNNEFDRPKFLLRQSSSLFSDGQFSNDDIPRGVVVNESDFGEDARPRPSDSNEPTPPSTRQNSMAEGAYATNAIDEDQLIRAAVMAHERSENGADEYRDRGLFPELQPSLERPNAQEFTQTDHLNRSLLMAAASAGIPSHFFEPARAGNDDDETDGPLSDEEPMDEDNYSPAMRAYLNQVRGQTGEQDDEEQSNDKQKEMGQSEQAKGEAQAADEDELTEAEFAPGKLMRQLTSTSDFEISDSASPSPAADNDPFVQAQFAQKQAMEDPFLSTKQSSELDQGASKAEGTNEEAFGQFEEQEQEEFEFQQAESQDVQVHAPSSNDVNDEEEDDDFGDFEEAGTNSVSATVAPSDKAGVGVPPQVTLAPPPAVIQPPAPISSEPPLDFVADSPDPDLKSFVNLSSCGKCGGPINFDLFSSCPACGDIPKGGANSSSSGRLSVNLSRSASSQQVMNGSEMVLNDLLSAIDFASCVEDPSALPIAALAASDNDNALRLLLGEDVIDTRRASLGHAQDVPSTPSTISRSLSQQDKNTDSEVEKSFFVV